MNEPVLEILPKKLKFISFNYNRVAITEQKSMPANAVLNSANTEKVANITVYHIDDDAEKYWLTIFKAVKESLLEHLSVTAVTVAKK